MGRGRWSSLGTHSNGKVLPIVGYRVRLLTLRGRVVMYESRTTDYGGTSPQPASSVFIACCTHQWRCLVGPPVALPWKGVYQSFQITGGGARNTVQGWGWVFCFLPQNTNKETLGVAARPVDTSPAFPFINNTKLYKQINYLKRLSPSVFMYEALLSREINK